jgi:adenosine deaminase
MVTPELPFQAPEDVLPEIRALPKCNLHTHLEGSVRPLTFIELAVTQGLPLPAPVGEMGRALQVTGEERSLADYLAKIALTYPLLKNAASLRRVSFEAAEDAARSNVHYLELRAGPVTHATPDLPVSAVIQAILDGLAQAEAVFGITCRLIVAALRHHDPQVNVRLARTALEFRGAGVVGFDLAGDEAAFPAILHREAFAVARDGGLGITVHAGEAGGADEVVYAVRELAATRIGHGVHTVEDPAAVELVRDRGVTLEVCPTSNVHTHAVRSLAEHPIDQLVRNGVRVTIGDDDPITSRTDVGRELGLINRFFGYGLEELRQFQIIGLQCCFLEDEENRARLVQEVEAAPA